MPGRADPRGGAGPEAGCLGQCGFPGMPGRSGHVRNGREASCDPGSQGLQRNEPQRGWVHGSCRAKLLSFRHKKRRFPARRRAGDRALRAYAQRAAASGQPAVRDAGVSVRAPCGRAVFAAHRGSGRAALPAQPCPAGGGGPGVVRPAVGRAAAVPERAHGRVPVPSRTAPGQGADLPLLLHAGAAAAAGLRRAQSGRYATGIRRHLRASDAGGDRAALAGTLPRPACARAG